MRYHATAGSRDAHLTNALLLHSTRWGRNPRLVMTSFALLTSRRAMLFPDFLRMFPLPFAFQSRVLFLFSFFSFFPLREQQGRRSNVRSLQRQSPSPEASQWSDIDVWQREFQEARARHVSYIAPDLEISTTSIAVATRKPKVHPNCHEYSEY